MSLPIISPELVQQKLKEKRNIPTLPTTFTELVRLTSDPNTSLHELATVVAYDPTLMASVLRVANSSIYGLKEPVPDLSTAVLYLGMAEIRRAALAVGSFELFMGKGKTETYLKDLWVHSLATGLLSQQIASLGGFDFSEEAYIAGLLHDFGKLFFATAFTKEYLALRKEIQENQAEGLQLEKESFGMTHLEVLESIGMDWKLPPRVFHVALNHHAPETSEPENRMISLCIGISNIFAHHMLNDEPVQNRMGQTEAWLNEIREGSSQPGELTLEAIAEILMDQSGELRCYEEVTSRPLQ
jgi:HD-like signal output (HDOD) protein